MTRLNVGLGNVWRGDEGLIFIEVGEGKTCACALLKEK